MIAGSRTRSEGSPFSTVAVQVAPATLGASERPRPLDLSAGLLAAARAHSRLVHDAVVPARELREQTIRTPRSTLHEQESRRTDPSTKVDPLTMLDELETTGAPAVPTSTLLMTGAALQVAPEHPLHRALGPTPWRRALRAAFPRRLDGARGRDGPRVHRPPYRRAASLARPTRRRLTSPPFNARHVAPWPPPVRRPPSARPTSSDSGIWACQPTLLGLSPPLAAPLCVIGA